MLILSAAATGMRINVTSKGINMRGHLIVLRQEIDSNALMNLHDLRRASRSALTTT